MQPNNESTVWSRFIPPILVILGMVYDWVYHMIYIYIYVHVYICEYIYIYMFIYLFIYVYIYIYTVYTYIYIYMVFSINGKSPKWVGYFIEHPFEIDDLGVPLL